MAGPARSRPAVAIAAILLLSGCTLGGAEDTRDDVLTLQPGLPGEANRAVDPDDVAPDASLVSPFSDADVAFLEAMRVHHEQALTMTALVEERTDREDVLLFVRRMDISQTAELEQLERMLAEHEDAVRRGSAGDVGRHDGHGGHGTHDGHGGHGGHGTHDGPDADGDHGDMPGMLSAEELAALAAATGDDFVRLFLEGMTRHHEGALVMVEELFAAEGSATDPRLFRFADHVDSDQRIELERMARLHAELPRP
nr:DUF305 domain-containing protein [uncultured Actinotalea sp.]